MDTPSVLTKKLTFIKPLHFPFHATLNDSLLHFHFTNTYPLILQTVLQCSWSYQEEGNALAITVLWPSRCQKDASQPSRCKGVNPSTLMAPESCDPGPLVTAERRWKWLSGGQFMQGRGRVTEWEVRARPHLRALKIDMQNLRSPHTSPHLSAHTYSSI